MQFIKDIKFYYIYIFAIIFVLYSRTLKYGFIWDDFNCIVNSNILGAGTNFFDLWTKKITVDFWPVTYSVLWILKYVFGSDPLAYHLANIILFSVSCALLFYLLNCLKIRSAFLITLIFCIHPMNVAVVSWVFQIKTNLANNFGLMSAIFFVKFFDKESLKSYFCALFFLILSFLSKITLVMLPFIFLLYIITKTKNLFSKKVLYLIPFFMTSIVFGLANIFWGNGMDYIPVPPSEQILDNSLLIRFLVMGQNYLFYVYQSFFPKNLMFVHPKIEPDLTSIFTFLPIIVLIMLLTISIVLVLFRNKKPIPVVIIGFLVSFAVLFPASGLFEVYFMRFSYVAEHYLTVALVGFIAPVILFLSSKRFGYVIIGVYVLFLGFQTYQYIPDYQNEKTVFERNLLKNPKDLLSHTVLGLHYKSEKDYTKALNHYNASIESHPTAAAYYNRAVIYELQDQLIAARNSYEKAIELNPYISDLYLNLGVIYLKLKNLKIALEYLNQALQRSPNDPSISYTFGYAYEINNNLLIAKEWYQKALLLSPSNELFKKALAEVSQQQSK